MLFDWKEYDNVEGMTHEVIESKFAADPDYVATLAYRGEIVDIFIDDYGQCYYGRMWHNGEQLEVGFGAYESHYHQVAQDWIDSILRND